MTNTVRLPRRRIHKTPRLVMSDAYTIGSNEFESTEAKEKSVYYVTFRKFLQKINPVLYAGIDTRMVLVGLTRLIEYLVYEPVTHAEIDETKRFLEQAEVAMDGLHPYTFPEEIWRKVVDEYNGRPPIKITALPEGSVFYPHEPVIQIECSVDNMGVLAAWFESNILKVWSATEMVTQLMHWFKYCRSLITRVYGKSITEADAKFYASLMLHNFGDRAAMTPQESEWLGADALYVFPGTDTFSGAYQAWKNAGEMPIFSSVKALAHRNIQSYIHESDCFRALYDATRLNGIGSYVADCYSFYDAVEFKLLPLAMESLKTGNGKVIVARPDSGNALEQVIWLCRLAIKNGLYTEQIIDGKKWRFSTYLKFIEGDGMTWEAMVEINDALLEHGFVPWSFGLFGVGGGLRNRIARDNTSTKYALCSVGKDNRPVVKFSEEIGKATLPGPFKLRRDPESMEQRQTIAFHDEPGANALVTFFDGTDIWDPFGEVVHEEFYKEIKDRMFEQMETMPETLATTDNLGFPITDLIREERRNLLSHYASKKLPQNF